MNSQRIPPEFRYLLLREYDPEKILRALIEFEKQRERIERVIAGHILIMIMFLFLQLVIALLA